MADAPWRSASFLAKDQLGRLIDTLHEQGYQVIGPVRDQDVIRLRTIHHVHELARGVKDRQDGGTYRLEAGDPDDYFDYVVGPDSPKRYLFPPTQRMFRMHQDGERFALDAGPPQPPKLAFVGIRPCELKAIAVQDKVFGADRDDEFRCESETFYRETRRSALLIAVNCTQPGGTCFCESMGTGPAADDGFDLVMTEIRAGFIIRVGSQRGGTLLDQLHVREASMTELELADIKLQRARDHMGRELNTDGVKQLLSSTIEHPHWDDVAKRCLGCGNCTMVCPTCFCSTVTDATDVAGTHVERTRQWESCFTHQFSYTTAGAVRATIRGRYRHWLRHKLGTWWDQFGTSGCVGCGRCITWCPVGIDLTREIEALRGPLPRHLASPVEMSIAKEAAS